MIEGFFESAINAAWTMISLVPKELLMLGGAADIEVDADAEAAALASFLAFPFSRVLGAWTLAAC